MGPTLTRYVTAISIQAGAAVWIRRLWAGAIPLCFVACAADTEPIDGGGRSYKSAEKGGETTEIAAVRDALAKFEKDLQERAEWEGPAWASFKPYLDDFKDEWNKKGDHRDALGEAVSSPKGLIEAGAYLAEVTSLAMLSLAVFMRGTWAAGPAGVVAGETAASTVGPQIGRISTGALKKMTLVGLAITPIVMAVMQLGQQQAAKFQDMKAMPAFDALGLQYDKASGRIMPKTVGNQTLPGMPQGSTGLPDTFPV
ncbi:hypothetical protein [Nonomuraea sp. NPDC003804]|uniref:hypothetical protein n=1 Tax=Nonomuraea sp. NPDC003804 TaxID=3154547 RepID=UPI0033BD7F51